MLVLRLADLTIQQASENTARHLGMPPARSAGVVPPRDHSNGELGRQPARQTPDAGTARLAPHPRASFELFVESVRQRALPWSTVEIDSALRLRMLVMELVISRTERLTALNAYLTRSNEELDAFAYVAAHDLKKRLRGIHRYAHQLLENAETLDEENRRRIQALMRLTVRMDSLLDSLLSSRHWPP